jgi:hypothetical protein
MYRGSFSIGMWFRPYGSGLMLSLVNGVTTYISVTYNAGGNSFSVLVGSSTLSFGPSISICNIYY